MTRSVLFLTYHIKIAQDHTVLLAVLDIISYHLIRNRPWLVFRDFWETSWRNLKISHLSGCPEANPSYVNTLKTTFSQTFSAVFLFIHGAFSSHQFSFLNFTSFFTLSQTKWQCRKARWVCAHANSRKRGLFLHQELGSTKILTIIDSQNEKKGSENQTKHICRP